MCVCCESRRESPFLRKRFTFIILLYVTGTRQRQISYTSVSIFMFTNPDERTNKRPTKVPRAVRMPAELSINHHPCLQRSRGSRYRCYLAPPPWGRRSCCCLRSFIFRLHLSPSPTTPDIIIIILKAQYGHWRIVITKSPIIFLSTHIFG